MIARMVYALSGKFPSPSWARITVPRPSAGRTGAAVFSGAHRVGGLGGLGSLLAIKFADDTSALFEGGGALAYGECTRALGESGDVVEGLGPQESAIVWFMKREPGCAAAAIRPVACSYSHLRASTLSAEPASEPALGFLAYGVAGGDGVDDQIAIAFAG